LTARRFHHCQNKKCRRRLGDTPLEAPAPSVYCEACETFGAICREQGVADGVASGVRLGYSRAAVVAAVGALLIAVAWAVVQF